MKKKNVLSQCGKLLAVFAAFGLCASPAFAQVSITTLTAQSQNFNGLISSGSGTWTNNSTIPGWYAGPAIGSATTIAADNGVSTTAGIKSLGVTNSTDRALASVSSSTDGGYYYGFRLRNNTGDVIRNFKVQFNLELWAKTSGNITTSVALDYRTGSTVTDLTSGTWLPANKLLTSVTTGGGPASTYNGNNNQVSSTFDITNIELANGQEIMFRWFDANEAKFIYLGLDDVVITPSGQTNTYYCKAGANPALLASWGPNADGSGTAPVSFGYGYQNFVLNHSYTLGANPWSLPGTNSKLIIGNGVNNVEFTIPAGTSFTGTVDVTDNATLTINSATYPTIGELANLSTVNYTSANNIQTVPVANYANLFVGNSNKKLAANTRVRKNLKLSNAKLELEDNDLLLDADAEITGADAGAFIVTKGKGRVKREVKNNNVEVEFPVGTDVYLPVKIRQGAGGTTDMFSVKAIEGLYREYTSNAPTGTAYVADAINKTWIIDEDVIGGSNVTVTIQWNVNDELAAFDRTKARISHFENGTWDDATPVSVSYVNGVASVSRPGITSFSPFGVISKSPGILPVALIGFDAKFRNQTVVCNWQTAQELNNDYFTVERSLNGKQFSAIGTVKGKGTTAEITAYQFIDSKPASGTVYYRLRQTDFDGTTAYSKIVAVQTEGSKNDLAFTVYPNPAASIRYITSSADLSESASVTVTNVQGQVISRQTVAPEKLRAGLPIDLKNEPKGLYFITITTGNEVTTLRSVQL